MGSEVKLNWSIGKYIRTWDETGITDLREH